MVLNNVTKFHKILIKTILLRVGVRTDKWMYGWTYEKTGVTLNAPAIIMAGA